MKRKIFLTYARCMYDNTYFPTTTLAPDERSVYHDLLGGDWFAVNMFGKRKDVTNFYLLCAAANDEL